MLSNVTFVLLVSFNCQIYCIKSLEPKFFTSYYSYKSNSFSPQERYSNKRMLNVSVLSFFICLHALGSLTAVVDSLMELDLMLGITNVNQLHVDRCWSVKRFITDREQNDLLRETSSSQTWVTSAPDLICGSSLATTPSQGKVPSPTCTSRQRQYKRYVSKKVLWHMWTEVAAGISYRALRAVLDIVDGQFDLRLLVDVGVLEEGDAAEEDGVTGALWMDEGNQHYFNDRTSLFKVEIIK